MNFVSTKCSLAPDSAELSELFEAGFQKREVPTEDS